MLAQLHKVAVVLLRGEAAQQHAWYTRMTAAMPRLPMAEVHEKDRSILQGLRGHIVWAGAMATAMPIAAVQSCSEAGITVRTSVL